MKVPVSGPFVAIAISLCVIENSLKFETVALYMAYFITKETPRR
jgi:hypothetical protein